MDKIPYKYFDGRVSLLFEANKNCAFQRFKEKNGSRKEDYIWQSWSLGHKASYGYILLVLEATMQISIDLQAILSY